MEFASNGIVENTVINKTWGEGIVGFGCNYSFSSCPSNIAAHNITYKNVTISNIERGAGITQFGDLYDLKILDSNISLTVLSKKQSISYPCDNRNFKVFFVFIKVNRSCFSSFFNFFKNFNFNFSKILLIISASNSVL